MEDIRFPLFADAGLNFYSNSIIVSKKLQREREALIPGLVRAILRASRRDRQPAEATDALLRVRGPRGTAR